MIDDMPFSSHSGLLYMLSDGRLEAQIICSFLYKLIIAYSGFVRYALKISVRSARKEAQWMCVTPIME